MAKKPTDRYLTAGELAKAAAAAADQPAPPAPVAPPQSPGTRQFSAVDPNPARTDYQRPYPPPPRPPAKKRFGKSQIALVVATIVMFTAAVVLAAVLVLTNQDSGTAPQTRLAVPPSTTTETVTPSPTDQTTTTTTTTSTTPTTSGPPIPGVSGTDSQGFVGHTARCEEGSTPAAAIRTAQSLAVVCETGDGEYIYRGERLRDGANIQLADAQPSGAGFTVTNPADGARYDVQPNMLTISSRGGVDSAEPALEYGSAD